MGMRRRAAAGSSDYAPIALRCQRNMEVLLEERRAGSVTAFRMVVRGVDRGARTSLGHRQE
jgi:hypothetical protein